MLQLRPRSSVARRDPTGPSICANCVAQDRSPVECPARSGQTKRPVTRAASGPRILQRMFALAFEDLPATCGRNDRPPPQFSGRLPSAHLYSPRSPFRVQRLLRRLATVPRRGHQGERICDGCWDAPAVPCRVCGEVKVIKNTRAGRHGSLQPLRKVAAPVRECVECGRLKPTHLRLPVEPYAAVAPSGSATHRRPAPAARKCAPWSAATTDDDASAAHVPVKRSLRDAPRVGASHTASPVTAGASPAPLARHCNDVIKTTNGETHPQLQACPRVFDLEHHPQAAVMAWARQSKSAQTLGRLAEQGGAITHQTSMPRPTRQPARTPSATTCVRRGLPARDDAIEGTKQWFENWILDADRDTAALLRRYLIWSVLRRARARRHRSIPVNPKTLRRHILTARHWLDG